MATLFRAAVMLVVLVGLPAAWVYYGPLPPAAMGVIERTVVSAKQSFGWSSAGATSSWVNETPKTAPRYDSTADASLVQATHLLQQQIPTEQAVPAQRPITRDPQFMLASATTPAHQPATQPVEALEIDAALAQQLEPHLALLRSLDAAEYTLENWGGDGQLYRFRCAVAFGASDDHTRQFEAVHADPLRAVYQVVGEVTSWQNARRTDTPAHWH